LRASNPLTVKLCDIELCPVLCISLRCESSRRGTE